MTVDTTIAAIRQAGGEALTNPVKDGNPAGWAAHYADDAVLMPPNGPAVSGRAALLEWARAFLAQFIVRAFDLEEAEIVPAGDWAYRRGAYRLLLEPVSGSAQVEERGKFLEIWQRQPDGSWKIARDIWNADRA